MSRDEKFGRMPASFVPRIGELLFAFLQGHTRIHCELRDHGQYGVEAMFLHSEEFMVGRTFHQRPDQTRTPREMAIAWAEEERKAMSCSL